MLFWVDILPKRGMSTQEAKDRIGPPLISPGPDLVANSLCPGQGTDTMREPEVQIGNSGDKSDFSGNGSEVSAGLSYGLEVAFTPDRD
jgi:hypothetical protein